VNVIGPTTGTRFRPRVAGDLAGRLWPPARWSFWISPASVKGRRWQRTSKPSCRTLPRSTATAAPPCVPTTMSWCSRWSVSRWIRRPRPSQQVSGQVVDRDQYEEGNNQAIFGSLPSSRSTFTATSTRRCLPTRAHVRMDSAERAHAERLTSCGSYSAWVVMAVLTNRHSNDVPAPCSIAMP
jgi:hypothetical protein